MNASSPNSANGTLVFCSKHAKKWTGEGENKVTEILRFYCENGEFKKEENGEEGEKEEEKEEEEEAQEQMEVGRKGKFEVQRAAGGVEDEDLRFRWRKAIRMVVGDFCEKRDAMEYEFLNYCSRRMIVEKSKGYVVLRIHKCPELYKLLNVEELRLCDVPEVLNKYLIPVRENEKANDGILPSLSINTYFNEQVYQESCYTKNIKQNKFKFSKTK